MAASFDFKRFSVENGDAGLKVGTDGVLLGAAVSLCGWGAVAYGDADMPCSGRILDIGTGTGVIALMLAQRTEGLGNGNPDVEAVGPRITGIDISCSATAPANFARSPWADRLEYRNESLAAYMDGDPGLSDLIVSNPPYYDNSLTCPDGDRCIARHTDTLSYREVITFAHDFLAPEGRIGLILPKQEETRLLRFAASFGFFPLRVLNVRTTASKSPSRIICEFSRVRARAVTEYLTISDELGYTDEYKQLTKEFYLNF